MHNEKMSLHHMKLKHQLDQDCTNLPITQIVKKYLNTKEMDDKDTENNQRIELLNIIH